MSCCACNTHRKIVSGIFVMISHSSGANIAGTSQVIVLVS